MFGKINSESQGLMTPTSSWQCMRAMDSDKRIMLSNWRTVILQEDFWAPAQSRWRRRRYSSTMKSLASALIWEEKKSKQTIQMDLCKAVVTPLC